MAKKQKRSPQDATLRNVRASKRRDASINSRIAGVEARVEDLERKLRELIHGIRSGLAKI